MKMFEEDMLHPLLQQMFKWHPFEWIQAEKRRLHSSISSSTRQDCIQDTGAVVLSNLKKKSFKVVFFYPFLANYFSSLLAVKPLNSYIFL